MPAWAQWVPACLRTCRRERIGWTTRAARQHRTEAIDLASMGGLSRAEVERYREDGYFLHHRPVFQPQQFAQLAPILEEHLAGAFGTFARSDQLDVPHFRDPRLLDFLRSEEALSLAMAALGTPNVGVWSTHIIAKEAG